MTENKTPESCSIKIKNFWSDFYSTPCFWLKVFSLIVLGLALFGLYKIVTSAFHYFNEPLSYFDPERLGQLGDFLGGTLNPIFGFATVCLLLWSVFIQKTELSLTRAELKKSSKALQGQLNQRHNESTRQQLGELLEQEYNRLEKIFLERFNETGDDEKPSYRIFWGFNTLNEIFRADIHDDAKAELNYLFENIDPTQPPKNEIEADFSAMWLTLLKASETIETITKITKDILVACELEPVERFWFGRWYDAFNKCHTTGVIGELKYEDMLRDMQQLRNSRNPLPSQTITSD